MLAARLRGSDFWHLARLKRISTTLASLTYFISAGNIKQSVIHGEGEEVRLSLLFWWRLGVLLPVHRKKPPGSQVFLDQWSSQDKLFLLFAFPVLPLHQRMGQRFWFCSQVKSSVMTMYEDEIRSQRDVILEALSPAWVFVRFLHLAGIVGSACATVLKISGLVVLY